MCLPKIYKNGSSKRKFKKDQSVVGRWEKV